MGLPLVLVLALVPIAGMAPSAAAAPADRLVPAPAPLTNVNTTTSLVAAPTSSAFGQSVTFTATVTPVPPATGTPTGSVTFVVDGVQASTRGLVGGSASFSTSVLGAGGHAVTATYSGDATFNQSSATIPYNVACGTTITGNQTGTITVTGVVCLNNAQVTGGIVVRPGGSLDVESSTITGSINAASSGAIRVCGSTIGGSVKVDKADGHVMIGDPTDGGCAINTIKGSLDLQKDTGGVEALGNKVSGSITQAGNSPPVEISSHAPPVAVNDNYSVIENQSLTVPAPGVLANDSAPSGGTLTASRVAGPAHGSLTLNADGSFSYMPAADFSGIDTFTYRNNDGVAFSDPATVIIKVIPQASITVVKSEPTPGAGVTVTAGQAAPITYNLAVTNSGGTGSAQVVVTDAVPAGTSYVAASASCGSTPSCGVNFAAGTVTWTLASVAATTTGTLSFQVSVKANDANNSTISNQANFTNIKTPGCGTAATCATNTVTNPVVTPASVTVVKSEPTPGAGTTVTAGQAAPITYQLAVANSGGTSSGAVTITDAIPAGTTYVAGSAGCGAAPNCGVMFASATVTWTLTSVPALSANNLTFQVTVDANDANNSTVSNQATFTNVMTPGCAAAATCATNSVSNPVITPASITVTKSEPTPGAGTTVIAGQAAPITYQLAVANSGGTASGSVTVTDAVPAGSTYVGASASCGTTPNCTVNEASGTVTWTLTSIAPLSTNNLSFQVTVNANDANGSTISNSATFTNVMTPGCGTAASCTTNAVSNPVLSVPAISVTKSEPTPGDGATVTAGQAAAITYQLAVTNSGGTASGSVTVTDAVPAGSTYVGASASCGTTPNCTVMEASGTVTWTLTSVAPLSTNDLSFQVTVDAGDANGSAISNAGTFTNVNTPGCGSAATCATNTVSNPVVTPASIAVTKSEPTPGDGVTVTSGQSAPITYQLAVTNSGGTAAGSVTVTDAIPSGSTYVAASASCGTTPNCTVSEASGTVTWTLTSVAPLSTNDLTFQVTVNGNDENGSMITNQGSFTDVNTPGCANSATCLTNTVTNPVITPASIAVVKTEPTPGDSVTVTAGQTAPITYQLAVSNSGGTAAGPVTVTDAVPTGTTYVAASASCGTTPNCTVNEASGTVTWTLTSVAPLSTNDLSFQVTVDASDANGSTISNQGSFTNVNTPGCGNAATCATNTVSNPVVIAPMISVVKSEPTPGDGVTVTAGQSAPITYQLAVSNSGGTASGSVTVTDAIPSGSTYAAASASCGTTPNCTVNEASGTVTWTLTSVAPSSTNDLTFQVTVNANDENGSIVTNQATFTNVNTPGCGSDSSCPTNTVTNPVVTPASVSVTKAETSPGNGVTVTTGATLSYGFTVANSGGSGSGSFTLTDAVPSGTTYAAGSATCPAGLTSSSTPSCTIATGATVSWTFSSIPAATTYSMFGFQVTVTAGDGTPISNTATFTDIDTPSCTGLTCTTNTVTNLVDLAPTVISTTPANGANDVLASVDPTVTFSKPVNVGGTAFTLQCPAGTTKAVTVSPASPAATFTLTPSAPLPAGTTCTVTVSASQVTDTAGTAMAANFMFSFTTDTPPTVTTNSPADGANDVLASVDPTVTFSKPVNVGGTAFTLECPVGTTKAVTVSPASPASTFTLTPSAPLPGGTTCKVTVSASQVSDVAGSALAADFTFSFTTDTAPAVLSTTPANGDANVPANVAPTVTFTKAVSVTSSAFLLQCPLGSPEAITVTPASPATTFTLTPSVALPTGTLCMVTVSASQVTDAAGSNLPADFTFDFTTDVAPTVTATTPANGATNVDPRAALSVTFSKSVNVTGTAFKVECPTGTTEAITVSPAGPANTFTLTPSAALPAGTMCTVTVSASQVTDPVGTAMQLDFMFSFTTDTPPTVTATTPANGATDVALSTDPTVTFSKAVTPTATAFTLECPSGTVKTISVSPAPPATTFTITPAAALPSFANCVVRVTASQVTDAASVAMASDFTFSFQTADIPVVVAQNYSGAVGNTTFGVGTSPAQPSVAITGSLLTGDTDPAGQTLTASGPSTTAQGGLLTVNANGTFTYNPPAGFTGDDTFTYTVSNGFHSASNTATITVAGKVWYVNSAVPANGNGRSISPFNTLSSVEPVAGTGDIVFLNGQAPVLNYTGGITLKANQVLLSTSVGLVLGGHTIFTAGGPNPTITNTAGSPAITLAENDVVGGINVNATSGAGVSASGVHVVEITSSTITSSGGDGLDVTGGNTGTFDVGAPITTSGGHSVSIQNRTGGTVTLSGAISDTGTGILLNANNGATIGLTGGITASTGAAAAFTATGGGTVTVTGANNTLTTTTGTAVNVANTTIGAGGLTFKSIAAGTAASGPASGIVLNNTGSSGGLTVTGTTATANSGGTIQHTTGPGISLIATTSPSFNEMNIHDTGGSGVRGGAGNGVGDTPGQINNFSFTNGTINNSDTAGTTTDDSNIGLNTTGLGNEQNVTGVVTITGNTLTNAFYHGVEINNYSGTVSNLTISNNTITSSTSTATSKGSGILVTAFGGPSAVASITKATIDTNGINNFPSAPGLQVQGGDANAAGPSTGEVGVAGNATNVVAITNNTVAGASPTNRIGAEGIIALVNGKGQGNFNISGNSVSNVTGIPISSSSFGFANVTETINSNTINAHNSFGAQGIGVGTTSAFTSADTPSLTTTITNNNISNTDGDGILAVARDATGTLKAKIQNNTVAAPLSGVRQGIRVDSGNTASVNETVCLNISGNTSAGSTGPAMGIGLRKQGTVSNVNTFGVNGMAATATPGVENYVNGLNPAGNGTLLISATSGFTNCSLP